MTDQQIKRISRITVLLLLLPLLGALGFVLIEGWSFFDALYMAVTTITTVGYQEVRPLSDWGRVFVMFYLAAGIGVFFYGVAQVGELIVRAEMHDWFGRRRMDKVLDSVDDHFVICGVGRMGRGICQHLAEKQLPFVVIDRDEQAVAHCRQQGWPGVVGDATDDQTLLDAGVLRARGLATALGSDADNLFVVLSARLLASDLQIIARSTDEKGAEKIRRAGANRVISMYQTGAVKMAQLLAKPDLEDFFEVFTSEGGGLDLAELHIEGDSDYVGKRLSEADYEQRGIYIVGIRRSDGELVIPVSSSAAIQADDRLIAMGTTDALANIGGP